MRMTLTEMAGVTVNAGLLAIMYTVFGAFISYVMYHLFDEFDDDWKKRPTVYKFLDVTIEVVVIAITAFWSARFVEQLPPFISVRKELDTLVDSYISGIFFIFAMFLFLDELTEKLKFLHDEYLGPHITKVIPQHGSLIDLSLSYSPRKTD
jgi:uncharacterized membrane-anchored protein